MARESSESKRRIHCHPRRPDRTFTGLLSGIDEHPHSAAFRLALRIELHRILCITHNINLGDASL